MPFENPKKLGLDIETKKGAEEEGDNKLREKHERIFKANERINELLMLLRSTEFMSESEKERVKKIKEKQLPLAYKEYEKLTGFPAEQKAKMVELSDAFKGLSTEIEEIFREMWASGEKNIGRLYRNDRAVEIILEQRELAKKLGELEKARQSALDLTLGPGWAERIQRLYKKIEKENIKRKMKED